MTELYRNESSNPVNNAQRNLMGRTHFVDPDTLRYHKSRVISARATDNGLLFAIVTSESLNFENTKRGFRYAIFDLFGKCLDRPDLEHAFRTSSQAEKAMWSALNGMAAKSLAWEAIAKRKAEFANEIAELESKIQKMEGNEQ